MLNLKQNFKTHSKQMMNLSALATGSFLLNSTMKSPLMTSSPATDNSIFDDVITKKYLKSSLSSNRSTTASDEKVCEIHPLGFPAEFFIILHKIKYKHLSLRLQCFTSHALIQHITLVYMQLLSYKLRTACL